MKIVVATQHVAPETAAGARRVGALVDALAEKHDVTVVAPRPGYPVVRSEWRATDSSAAYRVVRTARASSGSRSFVSRALGEIVMASRVAVAAWRQRPDAVVASSPTMFLGPTCLLAARLRRARFVWDVRDITWEYAAEQSTTRINATLAGAVRHVMSSVARRADLVFAATPWACRAIIESGGSADCVLEIPNGIANARRRQLEACRPMIRKRRPIIAYVGLIGLNQDVGVLVDVARALPEVDVILAGDGPAREAVLERASQLRATNLQWLGYLSELELQSVYQRADLLFAQVMSSRALDRVFPSKLFEYMAVGRPIIYAGGGYAAEQLRRAGAAVVVPARAAGLITRAARSLLGDPACAQQYVTRADAFLGCAATREAAMQTAVQAIERLQDGGQAICR